MAAFGSNQQPIQPKGRNWKLIKMGAVSAAALLGVTYWWLASGDGQQQHSKVAAASALSKTETVTPYVAPPVVKAEEKKAEPKALERPQQPPQPPAEHRPAPKKERGPALGLIGGGGGSERSPDHRVAEQGAERQGYALNKQEQWLASAGERAGRGALPPLSAAPAVPFIRSTTIIAATTTHEVNSDLPGHVTALIDKDVLDSTGNCVIWPYGTLLDGAYNNQLRDFQTRNQIVWNRALLPSGAEQFLGGMVGTDASGASGVEAEVDRHEWGMAGAVALSPVFSFVENADKFFQNDDSNVNVAQIGVGAAGDASGSIVNKIISRQLSRPNTLVIPQGYPVAVRLSQNVLAEEGQCE